MPAERAITVKSFGAVPTFSERNGVHDEFEKYSCAEMPNVEALTALSRA